MRSLVLLMVLAALGLSAASFVLSCDDDDDSGGSDDGAKLADGYHEGLGLIVTDADTGLRLLFPDVASLLGSKSSAKAGGYDPNANLNFDHPSARAACAKAGEKSGENWMLPTINQLRAMIVGCPETVFEGPCEVFDECPSYDCYSDDCNFGCALDGPGPGPGGCYSSGAFIAESCGNYWSDTIYVGENSANEYWWSIFYSAGVITTQAAVVADTMRVLCAAY